MRSGWCGCLVLSLLLSACGDDQPEKRPADAATEPKPEPVDPARRLVDLSRDEAERTCGALSDRFDDVLPGRDYLEASCTQQAWPVSFDFSNITGDLIGSPSRCKQLLAMCLDKGGQLGEFTPTKSLGADLIDPESCPLPAPGLDLAACDATLGDLETCAAAAASELGPRLARADCDALADPETLQRATPQVDITQLVECQGLLERCPIFTLDTQPDGRAPNAHQ
jgi:hypothetical protein